MTAKKLNEWCEKHDKRISVKNGRLNGIWSIFAPHFKKLGV